MKHLPLSPAEKVARHLTVSNVLFPHKKFPPVYFSAIVVGLAVLLLLTAVGVFIQITDRNILHMHGFTLSRKKEP